MTGIKTPCFRGHDATKYNRKDLECGRCHTLLQERYHATEKGKVIHANRTSRRVYFAYKRSIKKRIESKVQQIVVLESILERILHDTKI